MDAGTTVGAAKPCPVVNSVRSAEKVNQSPSRHHSTPLGHRPDFSPNSKFRHSYFCIFPYHAKVTGNSSIGAHQYPVSTALDHSFTPAVMPYPGRSWPTPPTKVPRRMAGIGEADQNAPSLEYHPNHLTILNLNEACTRGDLDSVKTQVAVWNTHLDPPPGPPGYEIYALEPVFYHAVEQGQGAIVSYFLDNGIHLCRLALYKAIGDEVSITVFHAYLDHGWDINNDTPGDGVYGLKAHPLGLVIDTPPRTAPYANVSRLLLSESNNHELVSWFLAHGADPNAVYGAGRFGQTNFTSVYFHFVFN